MEKIHWITYLLLLFLNKMGFAQVELRTIVPLSPNSAEMTKYIDAPVDYFTGVPAINIPLFNIEDGGLDLPLQLSYHAGGNKVESIATWIGLAWSLNPIPSITRSVNGLPDEEPGGFFYRYAGKSCDELYAMRQGTVSELNAYRDYIGFVQTREVDPEPDVFLYNINGESGKFYFNQKTGRFTCSPRSNIKIEFNNGNFTITSENGTVYNFYASDREYSIVGASSPSSEIASSWRVSSIQDMSHTHAITFDYTTEFSSTRVLTKDVKYIHVEGTLDDSNQMPPYEGAANAIVTEKNKRLNRIDYGGGYIKFIPKDVAREDFNGSYALDSIVVFNRRNDRVKTYALKQKYLIGGGSTDLNINKWMLLEKLEEIDLNGNSRNYTFEYKESNIPPSRISCAQDFWGYYNGKISNSNLIPKTYVGYPLNHYLLGADRTVDTLYSSFGIIRKMTFPTGGYRMFSFENNQVTNSTLPANFKEEYASIEANDPESPEPDYPIHKVYTTTFTISNPPHLQLNNNNINGGAFVSCAMDGLGVPEGSTGASIHLKGISSSNSSVLFYFTSSFEDHYLPNGEYVLTATFDQDPPNYQNFFCLLSWYAIDSLNINPYAGGLRVKRIDTYESLGSQPVSMLFKYTDDYNSNVSSGDIFSRQDFNNYDFFHSTSVEHMEEGQIFFYDALYLRLISTSNQHQVGHSGSLVGYKKVFVETSDLGQMGYAVYEYSHEKDMEQNGVPYPPPLSFEAFRGQLTRNRIYEKKGNDFYILKDIQYEYADVISDDSTIYGIKMDPNIVDDLLTNSELIKYYSNVLYKITPNWSALSKKRERLYDANDTLKYIDVTTVFEYNSKYGHLKSTSFSDSKNIEVKNRFYYPYDLVLSGDEEAARNALLNKHCVKLILKEDKFNEGDLLSTLSTHYRTFFPSSQILPYRIQLQNVGLNEVSSVEFNQYDDQGNLLEQQKTNDVKEVYLWGYNNRYPVAKIVGYDFNTVIQKVDTAVLNHGTDGQINQALLNLRNAFQSVNSAQVWTYTFSPLIGMTSETDPAGRTTYYEYDSFNRLKLIKDQNGKILKQYDYQYQKPITQ